MDFNNLGRASRNLPQPRPDGDQVLLRLSRYGDQQVISVMPTLHGAADDGAYFVATNPTPSSPLAYGSAGTQATFVDTVPFMQIRNNAQAGDPAAKRTYLQYLRIIQVGGTAPASTTSVHAAVVLDSRDRTASAGTPATHTPVNVNMDSPVAPVSQVIVFTGAVATIPARSTAGRLAGRAMLKGGPTLLLDEYNIAFGTVDPPAQGGYLTTVASYQSRMPPIVIGPQQVATVHLWMIAGATNPFTYEYELGMIER